MFTGQLYLNLYSFPNLFSSRGISPEKARSLSIRQKGSMCFCCMAANPGPLPVAICEFLNDTTCPAYKESSGYLSRIRYRMLKSGTVHNRRPSTLCLAIGSYVSLATSSVCSRTDCFLPCIGFRRKVYRCSVQAIQ